MINGQNIEPCRGRPELNINVSVGGQPPGEGALDVGKDISRQWARQHSSPVRGGVLVQEIRSWWIVWSA